MFVYIVEIKIPFPSHFKAVGAFFMIFGMDIAEQITFPPTALKCARNAHREG